MRQAAPTFETDAIAEVATWLCRRRRWLVAVIAFWPMENEDWEMLSTKNSELMETAQGAAKAAPNGGAVLGIWKNTALEKGGAGIFPRLARIHNHGSANGARAGRVSHVSGSAPGPASPGAA